MNKREGLWILKFTSLADTNDLGKRLRGWKPLVDGYITKLRGYLKEDDNVKILTLKGVGYRMVE